MKGHQLVVFIRGQVGVQSKRCGKISLVCLNVMRSLSEEHKGEFVAGTSLIAWVGGRQPVDGDVETSGKQEFSKIYSTL